MAIEQTVAESDEGQTSETGAQDEYEALLNEYSEGTKEPQKTPEPKAANGGDLQDLLSWVRQEKETRAQQQFNTELSNAVNKVKELAEGDYSERFVKGYLNALADEDPRVKAAWENRHNNPAGWEAALKKVAAEIQKDSPRVDANLTEDREAMAAAVRGVRKSTSDDAAPDVNKMSSQEFNKYLAELGIAR